MARRSRPTTFCKKCSAGNERSATGQHIRELELWWRQNRKAAPNAVREELQRILRVIRITPYGAHRATDVQLENMRRAHITRIWRFLYYRVLSDPERIELLALWSDSRGEGPPIGQSVVVEKLRALGALSECGDG